MLHAWSAVPGLGDMEVTVLRSAFKGADGLVKEGEGEPGGGKEDHGGGEEV